MTDPIIDLSPRQKELRVEQLRRELFKLGYSVVETQWLHSEIENALRKIAVAA